MLAVLYRPARWRKPHRGSGYTTAPDYMLLPGPETTCILRDVNTRPVPRRGVASFAMRPSALSVIGAPVSASIRIPLIQISSRQTDERLTAKPADEVPEFSAKKLSLGIDQQERTPFGAVA